jgi:hypothetical protein
MLHPIFMPLLSVVLVAFALAGPAAAAAPPPFDLPQLDKLEEALDLTPEQRDQYEVAVGATKRMLFHVALVGMRMKERLREELSKPRPDLNVIWELREAIVEEGRPLRREARAEWLKLYGMLNDDQVATLKRFVEERLDHVGVLHEFMMQLLRNRPR